MHFMSAYRAIYIPNVTTKNASFPLCNMEIVYLVVVLLKHKGLK